MLSVSIVVTIHTYLLVFYAIFIFNWIPAFVFQKKAGLDYLYGKKTIFDREIPSNIRSKITDRIFTIQNVLPMFSRLAIVGAIVLIAIM